MRIDKPMPAQNLEYMIIHAASTGQLDMVQQLLDREHVDVNVSDYDGRTPLHLAVAEGHERTAAFLMERGANSEMQDRFGNTPRSDAQKSHLEHLFGDTCQASAHRHSLTAALEQQLPPSLPQTLVVVDAEGPLSPAVRITSPNKIKKR